MPAKRRKLEESPSACTQQSQTVKSKSDLKFKIKLTPTVKETQPSKDEESKIFKHKLEQSTSGSEGEDKPRPVIKDFNSLSRFIDALEKAKRIVVVAGAGISVSCGIPDFRSENGVYQLVGELNLGLGSPEDLFDINFFKDDPRPFYKFARALYPGNYDPSPTHRFLKMLEDRGKLLRVYSQNIDGLEELAGITRVVNCHGSFMRASCLKCKKKVNADDIKPQVMRQEVPRCECGGVMRPDITFFGEPLAKAVSRAIDSDAKTADLVIVMGTSLKVAPVSRIISHMPRTAPQVLINRELVSPPKQLSDGFDLHLLGDCDKIVSHICHQLGWEELYEDHSIPPLAAAPARVPPNTYIYARDEAESSRSSSMQQASSSEEDTFSEVVTCDGCSSPVVGAVYSCRECFDYDLCNKCHSRGRNPHSINNGHSFRRTDGDYSMSVC